LQEKNTIASWTIWFLLLSIHFKRYAQKIFHYTRQEQSNDEGISISWITKEVAGVKRDTIPDIDAYEFGFATST